MRWMGVTGLFVAIGTVGCASRVPPESAPEAVVAHAYEQTVDAAPVVVDTPIDGMGGPGLGYAVASSRNGRHVFLRRWAEGVIPQFGHHGEALPEPEFVLLDFVDGTERPIDDLVEMGPTRRWSLVLADEALVLFDAEDGRGTVLSQAVPPDPNGCLPPRDGAFGPGVDRIVWMDADPHRVHARDLTTGESWTATTEARVWRALPGAEGRRTWLFEVTDAEGWPAQQTSCACRWCNRFAMSYGYYGWSGPSWTIVEVDDDGGRTEADRVDLPRWEWHGETSEGCRLVATEPGETMETGPFRWDCAPEPVGID